jgi:hypothetical protein
LFETLYAIDEIGSDWWAAATTFQIIGEGGGV